MIRVTPTLAIRDDEIHTSFMRSSGPGGQNVNKVETAVQLRFDAAKSAALTPGLVHRLRGLAGRRMTANGEIIITASRFRSQERNRQDAVERLISLLTRAATPPKKRRPTKPGPAARQRRLNAKHHRAEMKKTRAPIKSARDE
ncbi:MAG: alternative ribosome rescue aminoacyl-tRNA hydrolase ArfB [Alphaproteobacteria bacterium]|nr:alternative ribosome rescue aminoacyl-tRNA hydrolase ArfB [Alphaproteobacteria bacterium]